MMRMAAAAALAIVAACASSQEGTGAPAAPKQPVAQLSWAAPAAKLALASAPARASLIEFTVGAVRNPDQEAVTLALALIVDDQHVPVSLGTVSLFPSDQPGTFIVRLPTAATAALEASREQRAALAVSLQTTPASRQSVQLALTLTGARWIAEPK